MLSFLANILWFVTGGFWLGLSWVFCGVLCCCTIIGIPFGIACFRIARFSFFPFGKQLVPSENAGTCTFILNIIWVVFAGFWMALGSAMLGILYCITIIGIPWGIACFNIAEVSLAPLGKKVIAK